MLEETKHTKTKRLFMRMAPVELSIVDQAVKKMGAGATRADFIRDCIKRGVVAQIETEHGLSLA